MDRRAIREGKRPVVESSPSDDENQTRPPSQLPRPVGGVTIRDQPRAAEPPVPPRRPVLPPAVRSDPSGPAGLASAVTPEDVEEIRARYMVPDFIGLSAPGPEDRVTSDLPGRVALYEEFFRCGLRLPLHPFFLNVLDRYRLVPAQLTPNSIRIICAFVILCYFQEARPRLSLFRAFYRLRHQGEGAWWSFTARQGRAFPLGLPSKIRGWKSRFLFAHVEGVRTNWREPDTRSNDNSTVEDRDRDLFTTLSNSQIPNYRELLSEENLIEAELAPAGAMKLSAGDFRDALRQKKLAAGESSRPAKRARRERQNEPLPAAEAPAAPAAMGEPVEESAREVPVGEMIQEPAGEPAVEMPVEGTIPEPAEEPVTEMPVEGAVPESTGAGIAEREVVATTEPAVVVVDLDEDEPASASEPETRQAIAIAKTPAAAEPEAEKTLPPAEAGSATSEPGTGARKAEKKKKGPESTLRQAAPRPTRPQVEGPQEGTV